MCKSNEILAGLPEGASQDEIRAAFFEALRSLNVNDKCEKRDNLTYLSWANAWGEFKKVYPSATYRIINNPTTNLPYFVDPAIGVMVFTEVTANEQTHQMWLPVLNGAQKPMKLEPYEYQVWDRNNRQYVNKTVEAVSMFDINKTLMRCLVKNLAMFGLGLYIYAGEDLPENATGTDDSTATSTATVPAPTTAEVKPKKTTTTRKGRTVQQPTQPANDRYAGIKAAIAAMQDTNSLLALYNQHKNEVEGNEAIKALFTLRKYELQQAA
jgi:hypothetical protein